MKNITLSTIILLSSVIGSTTAKAQETEATKNAESLFVGVGGTFAKPKIMPRLEKLGLAQITITYKLTSTETTVTRERGTGQTAGAKLTAYLETTDGELTNEDFQEVTDNFYAYFQKKLKENGVDTVAWSAISNTDFYKDADEKKMDNDKEGGENQVWQTFNANKGNILYGGKTGFAFGKIKKASKFCDEIDAPAAFLYFTVDFAEIKVNLDIHSSSGGFGSSFYPYTSRTTSYKYKAATKPDMKIVTGDRMSMLWNAKSQSESITLKGDIESNVPYHTSVTQDPSRLKRKLFGFAKQMDPVVIETTRAQYKAAAGKALENYADAFIAKAKELKKD